MSLFNDIVTVGFVGVVLVGGPAPRVSAGTQSVTSAAEKVDDSTLKSRIDASVKKNATTIAHEIEVDVHEGIVTLKGIVGTAAEKTRVAELATIDGVSAVRNEIVVDAAKTKSTAGKAIEATKQAAEKTVDVTKDVAQKTAEKAKEIAGVAATATKEAASATGEVITDAWITTKLKTKFIDETLLKNSDINVDTDDHVVTLKGTVASSAAKAKAASIAGGTEGVTRVINELVVKAS